MSEWYLGTYKQCIMFQVLEEQHMSLEMDLSNLINSCEFVDHMITYGNEAEIMTLKKIMVSRLDIMNKHKSELDPRENDTIDFLPRDDPLKVGVPLVKSYHVLQIEGFYWLFVVIISD